MSDNLNKTFAQGKCRKCKYVRVYDFVDSDPDFCAAPCENCGADSCDIKRVKGAK